MNRLLLLISSILSLFVLSWSLGRYFGPKNCINSTVVGKVVIESTGQLVRSCDLSVKIVDPPPSNILTEHNVLKRIELLDSVSMYLDKREDLLSLVIAQNEPYALDLTHSQLRIGQRLLEIEGILERSLLYIKLDNGNPIGAQVSSDFLWKELIAHEKDTALRSWRSYLTTLRPYCLSDETLLVHYSFCRAHNELADSYIMNEEVEVVPWSLAALYTQIVREAYRELSIVEKKKFLENLIFLGEPNEQFLQQIPFVKSIAAGEESFYSTVKSWLMPVLGITEQNDSILRNRFVDNFQYNYILVGRSSRNVFSLDYDIHKNIEMTEPLIIQQGVHQFYYPSDIGSQTEKNSILEYLAIKNIVYVSCKIPDVESLLEYEAYKKRVVFVRQCFEEDVDWQEVSRNGLMNYLKEHSEVEFVEFNLTALRLAKRVRGPLRDTENFESWQKWLLWTRSVNESGDNVKRALSAIEGVRRYRIF